jgi:hypothetical protein
MIGDSIGLLVEICGDRLDEVRQAMHAPHFWSPSAGEWAIAACECWSSRVAASACM